MFKGDPYDKHKNMIVVDGYQSSQSQDISAMVPLGRVIRTIKFHYFSNNLSFMLRSEVRI